MKIFELKQKQAEALESLQWCADEDGGEYQSILDDVQGAVQNKLDYWLPLLKQAKFDHEQAVEAKRAYISAHDANIKRKEKVANWIQEHILSLMIDFNIEKHKGEFFNCSHSLSSGSLQFSEDFTPERYLPRELMIAKFEPDKEKIKEILKASDHGEEIVKSNKAPGCYLVKKQVLRVS